MSEKLPSGWERTSLGDLGSEVRGQVVPQPGTTYDLYSVPAFPSLRPERIDGSKIKSGKRRVQEGDVLLCKINPRINRVWSVGRAEGRPQLASTEYLVLRPHERDMGPYIRQFLSSPPFRKWIELSVEGATGSHTRAKSRPILNQPVPIAPMVEQERIVDALEEHFSRLDTAEATLADTKRKRSSLQRSAAKQLIDEARWPSTTLGDVADVFVGSTPSRTRPDLWVGPISWVSSGEIQFCRIRDTQEHIATEAIPTHRIHPPGTVLLGMIGEGKTRCQAAVLEIAAAHSQNSAAIRPQRSMLSPDWLFHVLRAQYESNRRIGSGNNQPALNKARVRQLEIPLPPLAEQNRLVGHLDEATMMLDQIDNSVEQAQRRCKALRNVVLAEAFAGRLVPQDPDDEAASLLLERIAASRPATPARRGARS